MTPKFLFYCLFGLWTGFILGSGPPGLRVYYTANREGEIEPCGCQGRQLGGIDRLAQFLLEEKKRLPERPVFLGDAGDTFFPGAALTPTRKTQQIDTAHLIAKAYRLLGVDAFTPGERDFAGGLELLKDLERESGVRFITTNLTDESGKPLFARYQILKKANTTVAVFGLMDDAAMPPVAGVKVNSALSSLKEALKEAKAAAGPDITVVLSHLGLSKDKVLARENLVDIILGSHSLDPLTEPLVVGKTWIVQPNNQGQQVGWIDFDTKNLKPVRHEIAELDSRYQAKNQVTDLLRTYREQVRREAFKEHNATSKGEGVGKKYVANPNYCRGCHRGQHDFWEKTKHASAYLVLFAKNQHFDPECIGCHALGFEEEAGFAKIAIPLVFSEEHQKKQKKGSLPFVESMMTKVFNGDSRGPLDSRSQPERYQKLKRRYHEHVNRLLRGGQIKKLYIGVQCEHCHGVREGHPLSNKDTLKKVEVESCRSCHRPPNAPAFDPLSIKLVACPLMAREN